ncbi:formylmethanofuran dehydrogenase subunit E family protein [Candidatus Formimonas warabiya]|uniref:Formylmethanofuran dehydrogenase subunit E domain-containing protein n=1 Tax=Formimonas warabiya TaxID=1761012 RepID=A0A3G1KYU5_FORW1|nr:formylmethanofuran dehydrogenase subunit E family protein [Candidatus Formimonas warabiya]ATW27634.1 hypothetical protein DCMF_25325 [Candidatus Formimonas warabiya]
MALVESLTIGTVLVSQELMGLVNYHGHLCPELAIGYRVSRIAMNSLHITRENSLDFIAGAANSSSAVDAIQYLTGCTIGKQNFFIEDVGKHVYFFVKKPLDAPNNKGLFIKMKTPVYYPRLTDCVMDQNVEINSLTREQILKYRAVIDQAIGKILHRADNSLFDIHFADFGKEFFYRDTRWFN